MAKCDAFGCTKDAYALYKRKAAGFCTGHGSQLFNRRPVRLKDGRVIRW